MKQPKLLEMAKGMVVACQTIIHNDVRLNRDIPEKTWHFIRLAATVNAKSESAEGSPSVPTESFQLTNEQRKYLVRPYDSDRVCLLLRNRIYPYVRDFGNLQTWAVVRIVMAARGYFKVAISNRVFASLLVAVIPDYTNELRLYEAIRKNQHTRNITPESYPHNVDDEVRQEGAVIEELLDKK